jgi:hypothetical protein
MPMSDSSPNPDKCSVCGSVNPLPNSFRHRSHMDVFSFIVPEENDDEDIDRAFKEYDFTLCYECQRKIVDWIDECSEDEVRFQLIGLEDSSKTLEHLSEELDRTARRIQELAEGENPDE